MVGYEKLKELWQRRDAASTKYLELRDAKSNGCCYGLTIPQIVAYDMKIESAAEEVKKIDAEIKAHLEACDIQGQ